jgi:hypothetical protein
MSLFRSSHRSRYGTVLLVVLFAPLFAILSSGPSSSQTVTGEATAVALPKAVPLVFAGDVRDLPNVVAPLRREAHATGGHIPVRGAVDPSLATTNLTYHGGPVIASAKVVFIFWGPGFANASSPDHLYAQTLQSFRNQYGTTPEYNVITQYSGIQLASLGTGTPDLFDTSTPPTEVTDAIVQEKVDAYLASHAFDASTIYEVVIPSSSYSSDGSATSCGGPNLTYCAYHGFFPSGSNAVKYSIQPYPSCSGCQLPGWSDVQNLEHFVTHETREAVTDEQGDAWWDDSNGSEADDKCAWNPTPFIGTGGYAYQYEWSNASSSCVRTVPITNSPSVTTSPASSISQSAATIGGTVNPKGASTNAYFQWGTTTGYGNTTGSQNVGSGTASVPYSANLSGLSCGTTYHYQAVATNSSGTGYGGDQSFTTGACLTGGYFYSVVPCRLLDTRNSSPLTAGVTYEVAAAGFCGIATTATSISVNVTDVNATNNGFMTFWPAQGTNPGTSTLNFTAGRTLANNAIFGLAPGYFGSPGAIWLTFTSGAGTSNLLIDVNGFFQ